MKFSSFQLILSSFLFLALFSCQKEDYVYYGKVIEGQFMKAIVNGEEKIMVATDGGLHNNIYYYREYPEYNSTLDQLNLLRKSADGREEFHLYASGWQLQKQNFPLNMAREHVPLESCQPVELQYLQRQKNGELVRTTGIIDMQIAAWDATGYMIGSFSGSIGGLEITNGSFRIRVFSSNN